MYIRISPDSQQTDSGLKIDVCSSTFMPDSQICKGIEETPFETSPLPPSNSPNDNISYYSCVIDMDEEKLNLGLKPIRLNLTMSGNPVVEDDAYHPALTDLYKSYGGCSYRMHMSSRERQYMIETFDSKQSVLRVLIENGFKEIDGSQLGTGNEISKKIFDVVVGEGEGVETEAPLVLPN